MEGDWQGDLERWLEPYLQGLGNKTRRRMCPAYIAGLIGPGDRKSIQPMAARVSEVSYDRLHHFIGAGIWDSAPLEATLWRQADELVGGDKAWLIIDDTALPKKGKASVGVAPQYATALGKNANCQTLVSVTLASGEVPVMLSLRLFLPESWTRPAAKLTIDLKFSAVFLHLSATRLKRLRRPKPAQYGRAPCRAFWRRRRVGSFRWPCAG